METEEILPRGCYLAQIIRRDREEMTRTWQVVGGELAGERVVEDRLGLRQEEAVPVLEVGHDGELQRIHWEVETPARPARMRRDDERGRSVEATAGSRRPLQSAIPIA